MYDAIKNASIERFNVIHVLVQQVRKLSVTTQWEYIKITLLVIIFMTTRNCHTLHGCKHAVIAFLITLYWMDGRLHTFNFIFTLTMNDRRSEVSPAGDGKRKNQ